jgi:hypothetical protein
MLWIVPAVVAVVVVVVVVVLAVEAEVRMCWRRVGLYYVGVAHKVAPPLDMIHLKTWFSGTPVGARTAALADTGQLSPELAPASRHGLC